ncbi:hypothetical protein [Nakamurella sp.]|uniref:hypothetical protein n=1 Tax=Nakamurella sp. TaxID=1869182 RepID=UPI0037835ECC
MTELSAVSTGTMIRLADETVTLERVEHLETEHSALSPVSGVGLTRIRFRRNGRTKRRIYPSRMLVERVRRGRNRP